MVAPKPRPSQETITLCKPDCSCKCHQPCCGCHSMDKVFIPNRPIER